jgi:hypothetical protein
MSKRGGHILPWLRFNLSINDSRALLFFRQYRLDVIVRTSDDVNANEFAFDCFDGLRAGVRGGFDRGDIAGNARRYERVTNLRYRADELYIRGLEHGVRALDERDESARFNEADCLWHIFIFG